MHRLYYARGRRGRSSATIKRMDADAGADATNTDGPQREAKVDNEEN